MNNQEVKKKILKISEVGTIKIFLGKVL